MAQTELGLRILTVVESSLPARHVWVLYISALHQGHNPPERFHFLSLFKYMGIVQVDWGPKCILLVNGTYRGILKTTTHMLLRKQGKIRVPNRSGSLLVFIYFQFLNNSILCKQIGDWNKLRGHDEWAKSSKALYMANVLEKLHDLYKKGATFVKSLYLPYIGRLFLV